MHRLLTIFYNKDCSIHKSLPEVNGHSLDQSNLDLMPKARASNYSKYNLGRERCRGRKVGSKGLNKKKERLTLQFQEVKSKQLGAPEGVRMGVPRYFKAKRKRKMEWVYLTPVHHS